MHLFQTFPNEHLGSRRPRLRLLYETRQLVRAFERLARNEKFVRFFPEAHYRKNGARIRTTPHGHIFFRSVAPNRFTTNILGFVVRFFHGRGADRRTWPANICRDNWEDRRDTCQTFVARLPLRWSTQSCCVFSSACRLRPKRCNCVPFCPFGHFSGDASKLDCIVAATYCM